MQKIGIISKPWNVDLFVIFLFFHRPLDINFVFSQRMSGVEFDSDGWKLPGRIMHRIHLPAREGDLKTLSAELKQSVSADLRAKNTKRAPLSMAAWDGHLDAMKLLVQHKADVDAAEEDGWTALHVAHDQHPDCVQLLLDGKADVNKQSQDGFTGLLLAAINGNRSVVKLLLTHKADSTVRDSRGQNAVDIAANNEFWDIVQLMLAAPEAPRAPFLKIP